MKHIENRGHNGRNHTNLSRVEPIVAVYAHNRADNDEMLGTWQFDRFGAEAFPGVKNAKLVFLAEKLETTYPNRIYIGLGGTVKNPQGYVFDEHTPQGRLQGTCAALLVAQRLRVLGKPGMKELLEETLWCDTQPKVGHTQLANLIKIMHRVKGGGDQEATYLWASAAYDAIVFGRTDERFDLEAAWKDYSLHRGYNKAHNSTQKVSRYIRGSVAHKGERVTELAAIASKMRSPVRERWLKEAFRALYLDEVLHMKALAEMKEKPVAVEIDVDSAKARAFFIESDNEYAGKAAKSSIEGPWAIVAIRSSSGQYQVVSNPNGGPSLEDFATMVRMAEHKARTGRKASIVEAMGNGTKECSPEWHLAFERLLLSGSFAHPYNRSLLPMSAIIDIAKSAFSGNGQAEWIERYESSPDGASSVQKTATRDGWEAVVGSLDLGAVLDGASEAAQKATQ
ncbi:MAG: hypothetical protein HZA81_03750 [Candidatus Taylorbacteria bacterium]|nr:hypothetical protein [Candidatus Taylorbacteria bacterium]